MPLAVGEVFAGYTVVRKLGAGGMGSVYLAQHPRLPRQDALKVLSADLTSDPSYQARFLREADLVATLSHPNILGVHDRGEYQGQLWIAMDYVRGTDAATLVDEHYRGGMLPDEALKIITAVASALDYAHQKGLLHRDVKPANILLAEPEAGELRIFLADFGIARPVDDTAGLTATNLAVGTVAYAAPEQLMGGPIDGRADQYALACTAFQLLTGSKPYDFSSAAVVITKHVMAPPPSIGEKRIDLARLDPVFAKAMAKKPDDRFASCQEFAEQLRRALIPEPTAGEATQVAPTTEDTQFGAIDVAGTQLAPAPGEGGQFASINVQATQPGELPPPPLSSRHGWTRRLRILVPALLAVALLAGGGIFAAVKLSQPNDNTPPATPAVPGAVPDNGPFTGTYTVDLGPQTDLDGKPLAGAAPPAPETWAVRSVCGPSGCLATASRKSGQSTRLPTLVFDEVGDRWVAVGTTSGTCADAPAERWEVMTLQPQPDGRLAGEYVDQSPAGCALMRTVSFTRTADVDVAGLPDPAGQAPRVVSGAEALRGHYHESTTYSDGSKAERDYAVRTDCLRSGERCISFFHGPENLIPLVFVGGKWTLDNKWDAPCEAGGTSHVTITAEFLLPQPPQDPITLLTGHGRLELSGSACADSGDYERTFERTGD